MPVANNDNTQPASIFIAGIKIKLLLIEYYKPLQKSPTKGLRESGLCR